LFTSLSLLFPTLPPKQTIQNLDIETIDALCDAIKEFNGGVVVVTHDQRLIEECECTLWVVEKRGVTRWDAGFDDYKESILRELEEAIEKENMVRRDKLEAAAAVRAEKLARLTSLKKTKSKKGK
jgi:ATP-binding cassette, subfamily F, member 1